MALCDAQQTHLSDILNIALCSSAECVKCNNLRCQMSTLASLLQAAAISIILTAGDCAVAAPLRTDVSYKEQCTMSSLFTVLDIVQHTDDAMRNAQHLETDRDIGYCYI
jgi:hypothetical protein